VAPNSLLASLPGSERVTTVLRVFRFDGASGAAAEIRARVAPGDGVTVRSARMLVTGRRPGRARGVAHLRAADQEIGSRCSAVPGHPRRPPRLPRAPVTHLS
jgi:hypothetical protein